MAGPSLGGGIDVGKVVKLKKKNQGQHISYAKRSTVAWGNLSKEYGVKGNKATLTSLGDLYSFRSLTL